MVQSVKALAELNVQLNVEERNLLSVAYKNVVGARRASWRVLSSIESKEKEKGDADKVSIIAAYRDKVRPDGFAVALLGLVRAAGAALAASCLS